MSGPLTGTLVLDLGFVGVGPIACSTLASLGARVIKVESPNGDPAIQVNPPSLGGRSVPYLAYNQGKEGIILDLKDDTDQLIFRNMIKVADILCINWKPGQAERLQIGYEQLRQINGQLIFISCPGYGSTGPYRDLPSFDPWGANLSGYTSLTGQPGECGEIDRGPLPCDVTTSATVVQAALIGLYHRARTGLGQKIETSQLQAACALVQTRAAEYLVGGRVPRPLGSATATVVPSQAFQTSDGWLAVSAETPLQWQALCQALQRQELQEDARFATNADRVQNRDLLVTILAAIFNQKTNEEWSSTLAEHGVPSGPFRHMRDTRFDPYVRQQQMVYSHELPGGNLDVGGVPWRMSKYELLPGQPLLSPGADSLRIAREFGAAESYTPKAWKGKPEGTFF